ncbi:MAG: endoglucanase, partial [Desulfobacteraceae bacterium]|nr:endoglucanase [Desulfobacteraceae bacterium]
MNVRYAILFVMMLTAYGLPVARAEYPASPPKPFWGAAVDGYPVTHGLLETVEKEMGFSPQIVVFFLQWPASGSEGEFPRSSLDIIRSR